MVDEERVVSQCNYTDRCKAAPDGPQWPWRQANVAVGIGLWENPALRRLAISVTNLLNFIAITVGTELCPAAVNRYP